MVYLPDTSKQESWGGRSQHVFFMCWQIEVTIETRSSPPKKLALGGLASSFSAPSDQHIPQHHGHPAVLHRIAPQRRHERQVLHALYGLHRLQPDLLEHRRKERSVFVIT